MPRNSLTPKERAQLVQEWKASRHSGRTAASIGEQFGVTASAVYYHVRKALESKQAVIDFTQPVRDPRPRREDLADQVRALRVEVAEMRLALAKANVA